MISQVSHFGDYVSIERDCCPILATSKPTKSFVERSNDFGLERDRDFRWSDLKGCDFSFCDLRGYDFTGADLSDTFGLAVEWDSSTILKDATLSGSLFASAENIPQDDIANPEWEREFSHLSKEDASYSLVKVTEAFGRHPDKAMYFIRRFFFSPSDIVTRNNMLYCAGAFAKNSAILKEFLLYIIGKEGRNVKYVRSSISIMATLYSGDAWVRRILFRCVESNDEKIKMSAIRGLFNGRLDEDDIRKLCHRMASELNASIRKYFLKRLAIKLGLIDYVSFIDNSVIDFGIPIEKRDLIRIGFQLLSSPYALMLFGHKGRDPDEELLETIRAKIEKFLSFGVPVRFEGDEAQKRKGAIPTT